MRTPQSVAVVVPVYRESLTENELISYRHLRKHLSGYDTFLMTPQGLTIDLDGIPHREFDPAYFAGVHTYSNLLLSHEFYEAFADFDYILIYQLDCLVFSDQLKEWCAKGYDYVGAPWTQQAADGTCTFTGVGNGGFSLRNVHNALRVLDRYHRPHHRLMRGLKFAGNFSKRALTYGMRALKSGNMDSLYARSAHTVKKSVRESMPAYRNEDIFWSEDAKKLWPDFRIPPPEIAVRFAFETHPRFCFEQTGKTLPFGCHNWPKYDFDFWKPFIEPPTT